MRARGDWTEENVEILKTLWAAGKTAAEVAKELGEDFTRNSVLAKIHRLRQAGKIPNHAAPRANGGEKIKQESKERAKREQPVKASRDDFYVGIKLVDLKPRCCIFAVSDHQTHDHTFCGAEVSYGQPYCAKHSKMAYNTTTNRSPEWQKKIINQSNLTTKALPPLSELEQNLSS